MTLRPRVVGGVATLVRDISGESCSKAEGGREDFLKTESGGCLKTRQFFLTFAQSDFRVQ